MPFSFKSLSIPEVILVEPEVFSDDRGYFLESFKSSDFSLNHIPYYFVQDKKNLVHKYTKEYDPKLDSGIRWDDPDIGIEWPINKPVVSEKDQHLPYFKHLYM